MAQFQTAFVGDPESIADPTCISITREGYLGGGLHARAAIESMG